MSETAAHDGSADGAVIVPFPSRDNVATGRDAPSTRADLPPLREVLGDVLREERHAQARTLADVARGAAVSLPYLSEVERGVKEVSSDVLAAICDALSLSLADVLERSVERLRPGTQRDSRLQLRAA